MPFDPVILFFLLGLLAGVVRSDLRIPGILYESMSIFLLLAIGLKGGIELARYAKPIRPRQSARRSASRFPSIC